MAASHPILVAATPRAGRHKHVNLVPSALPPGFEPSDMLGAAAFVARGIDYLAAVRSIAQPGSERTGREVLVLTLVGLRVQDEVEEKRVLDWLERKLEKLSNELDRIDWDHHDGGAYPLAALDEWNQELGEFRLDRRRPPTAGSLRKRMLRLLGVLIVAIGILGVGILTGGLSLGETRPKGGIKSKGGEDRVSQESENQWNRFMNDVGIANDPGKSDEMIKRIEASLGVPHAGRQALQEHPRFKNWLDKNYPNSRAADFPFEPFLNADPSEEDTRLVGEIESLTGTLDSGKKIVEATSILFEINLPQTIPFPNPDPRVPFLTTESARVLCNITKKIKPMLDQHKADSLEAFKQWIERIQTHRSKLEGLSKRDPSSFPDARRTP